MNFSRRRVLRLTASAAALPFAGRALAETYPARPGRIIVGFPASNASDIVARLGGQMLTERLGQSFVTENRPGAGGNIGVEAVVNAAPDGYTLLLASPSTAINATLYEHLNFSFLRDIAPVAGLAQAPYVLVTTPAFPAKSVPDLIVYAKANPGQINMASAGNGSLSHLCGELFKSMTGIAMLHVPYRASYLPDLLAGQVQLVFAPVAQTIDYIRGGKLKAIAVTVTTRQAALPGIPAIAEFVPGYDASAWYGFAAPRNTPAAIVDTLNKAINTSLAEPVMKAKLENLGAEPMPTTPEQFANFIAAETEKWGKIIRAAHIKAD